MAIINKITLFDPPKYVRSRGKIKHNVCIKEAGSITFTIEDWKDYGSFSRILDYYKTSISKELRRRRPQKKSGGKRLRDRRRNQRRRGGPGIGVCPYKWASVYHTTTSDGAGGFIESVGAVYR